MFQGDRVMVEVHQTGRLSPERSDRLGIRLEGGAGPGPGGSSWGSSKVAVAGGVVTGMGEGWVVVFAKYSQRPRSSCVQQKLTGRNAALWVWRGRSGGDGRGVVKTRVEMGGESGRVGALQEGDVVELWVFSVVENRHHSQPEFTSAT